MIRIGDFARLANVSVETLRHYDELGLLKPGRVDEFTGYRYYAANQMAQLHRILALKDLGFSLAQVQQLLGETSLEQLSGMLKLRRAESERALADEEARLKRIAARLKLIDLEERMPEYEVVLRTLPPTLVASRKVTIPRNDQVPEILGGAFDAAYRSLRAAGMKDSGPCLAIWHQPAAVQTNEVVEAAVPVERAFESTNGVAVYELPGGEVASTIHDGPFEGMVRAHAALLTWIEENGYESNGTYREVYLSEASPASGSPVTEIQYPLHRR